MENVVQEGFDMSLVNVSIPVSVIVLECFYID